MTNPRPFREFVSERAKSVTPKQAAIIDDFFEIVREWDAGNMPLAEAEAQTGDGWLRNQVITHTSFDHADYATAMRFLDALTAKNSPTIVRTKFGTFTLAELQSYGAKFETRVDATTGEVNEVITFPGFTESNPQVEHTEAYLREQRRKRSDYTVSPYQDEWLGNDNDQSSPTD
jgi:hypothetical protein